MKNPGCLFTILLSLIIIQTTHAQKYWVGSIDNLWSNGGNWSNASGGTGGAGTPLAGETIIFDNMSSVNCTIDTNTPNLANLTVNGYTETITQSATITVTNTFTFSSGTFNGGSQNITTRNATINGGNFTSTSGIFTITGTASFLSTSFFHNNGTVYLHTIGNNVTLSGSANFYDLIVRSSSYDYTHTVSSSFTTENFTLDSSNPGELEFTLTSGNSITVNSNFTIMGGNNLYYFTGTIYAKGDININGSYGNGGSTGIIEINGNGTQNFSSMAASQRCILGSIIINKPSGTLNLSGTITTQGPAWTYLSGTINPGTSTIYFYDTPTGNPIVISGTHTLNNVRIIPDYTTETINNNLTVNDLFIDASAASVVLSITSSITVNGSLTLSGGNNISINTGTIHAKGDIDVSTATYTGGGGSGTIRINGTVDQNIFGNGTSRQGNLPNIIIEKTSGALNLTGYITVVGSNWTYTSGIINPGSSTITFYHTPGGPTITVSGTHSLNNVNFFPYYSTEQIVGDLTVNNLNIDASTTNLSLNIANTLTVQGTLTLSGGEYIRLHTGTVYAHGDVNLDCTNPNGGGSATLNICGSSNQTIKGSTDPENSPIPKVVINKPSQRLTLQNYITVEGGWTHTQGTVDAGLSTVFLYTLGSANISASGMSFNNLRLNNAYNSFTLGGNLDVNGDLIIDANTGLNTSGSSYAVNIGGNLIKDASATYTSNSSVLTFDGSADQEIMLNNPVSNVTINKASGAVVLMSPLTISGTLTMTNGLIKSTSTNYIQLNNGASTTIGNATSYIDGPMRYMMAFNGNRTLNFPLGKSEYWNPLSFNVTHSNGDPRTYTAEVINSSADALGYTIPATFTHVSKMRYWQFDRSSTQGFNSGTVTLYYNTNDFVPDAAHLGIAKSTGNASPWTDLTSGPGSANESGSITSASFSTIGTTNQFALTNLLDGINPLPLQFIFFNGKSREESIVLEWRTGSEINNDYFEIQRSMDGIRFHTIGNVKSYGNRHTEGNYQYQFKDNSPLEGSNYYRITQHDFDGNFTTSEVILVKVKASFHVYPNPVKDEFMITLSEIPITTVHVSITSLNGVDKIEYTIPQDEYNGKIVINQNSLRPGNYLVQIKFNETTVVKKIHVIE